MTTQAAGRNSRVLVVDDDPNLRTVLQECLAGAGFDTGAVETGEEALRALERDLYDVVLLDLHLPRMQGLTVLTAATALQTDAQFIVMTAFGTVDEAVEAMRLGAYDFLTKPFRLEELLRSVKRACEETELRREVARLRQRTKADPRSRIIGRADVMDRMFDLIERVAPMRATALITGETGTGKELVARAIHALSTRANRAFVPINCSALPESLLESELFGHVRGSFTGAVSNKRGLFEEASGGTLFLDEIGTISTQIQVKLLRVLEERTIQRVGSTQQLPVDFRLIVATNEDLAKKVERGEFREDLFYRLNVFPITVPPLRERKEDIPLLANHFRARFAEENGLEPPVLTSVTVARMMAYDWPGNVRELENAIERAVILYAGAREIRFDPPGSGDHSAGRGLLHRARDAEWSLERLEREYILAVLERTSGHQSKAASVLGIDRRTLYRKLREMNVRLNGADTQMQPC